VRRTCLPFEGVTHGQRVLAGTEAGRRGVPDERWYAPLSPTVGTRPLYISLTSQNRWCDILYASTAGLVNRHYHPQQVFAYTISGKWGCAPGRKPDVSSRVAAPGYPGIMIMKMSTWTRSGLETVDARVA
jgi:hypothetical protein